METDNHLFEKGNHLPNLHFLGFHVNFQGGYYFAQNATEFYSLCDVFQAPTVTSQWSWEQDEMASAAFHHDARAKT